MKILKDSDLCYGCGACCNVCESGAIQMKVNEEGFYYPTVNDSLCVDCNKCRNACPILNPTYTNKLPQNVHLAIPKQQAAGTFPLYSTLHLMAEYVLKQGRYVCGTVFDDDFKGATQKIISKAGELDNFRFVNFIQNKNEDFYKCIKNLLEDDNSVLFIGTPCQCAALKNILKISYKKLTVIDTICGGVLSPNVYKRILDEVCEGKKISDVYLSYDGLTDGSVNIHIKYGDGEEYCEKFGTRTFGQASLQNLCSVKCCGNCQFSQIPRQGDISVGGLAEVSEYNADSDDYLRYSVLLENSEKGMVFLNELKENNAFENTEEISFFDAFSKINSPVCHFPQAHPGRENFYELINSGHSFAEALEEAKKKKYQIALFSIWYAANFGSLLTNYALYTTLTDMGYKCFFADIPDHLWSKSLTHRNPFFITRRFGNKHFEITEKYKDKEDLKKLNDLCDTFVVGFDQIWNYKLCSSAETYFFLDFVNNDKRKISYGTSFGHNKFSGSETDRKAVKKCLRQFDAVSVREDYAIDLCREKFGVESVKVLDPVFLCDKNHYYKRAEDSKLVKSPPPAPYLLAYILDPNEEKQAALEYAAQKLGGIDIICIPNAQVKENMRKEWRMPIKENIDVEDWLYYFKNAQMVITDSFHGACFSIIFERQFISIVNRRRGKDRFYSLLKEISLVEHLVEFPSDILTNDSLFSLEIDYKRVHEIIGEKRENSILWLKNALSKEIMPKTSQSITISDKAGEAAESKASVEYEQDNVLDLKKLKQNTVINKLDLKLCTGCSACGNVCPTDAITMICNKEGFLNPFIDADKCIDCGLCAKKCIALNPQYKNNPNPDCYAMMADDEIRKVSSSGGMFTVAAEYILDQGGYVCGAAYREDFSVEHIIVNDKKELYRMRGSKYMQSNPEKVYKEIKRLLEQGEKVLFTGMPCQVAGLYSFLGKDYDSLFTIDLLCHGITSSKVFEKYHREILDNKPLKRLEFKEKEPWGWHAGVNAYFTDGTKYSKPLQSDLYFIAYLKSISKNTTCGSCVVNRLPRQGDLSIGDFWGISKYDPDMNDGKGTSVVLVNNQKGQDFFNCLSEGIKQCRQEPLEVAITRNRIIKAPYKLHKNRNMFFENFDSVNFGDLTLGCYNDNLHERLNPDMERSIHKEDRELYFLAKAAAENCNDRQIVTWIRSRKFEQILQIYFNKTVAFGVTMRKEAIVKGTVEDFETIKGNFGKYYLVSLDRQYDNKTYEMLNKYGYMEIRDFVFRKPKPIVLENIDLSKGSYSDIYGNIVKGSGIIGKITFRGCNNRVTLGNKISGTHNLYFDLTSNSNIVIGHECHFAKDINIQTLSYNGFSEVEIKNKCRFKNAFIRLYNNPYTSSVLINEKCTFETDLELHANSGKKIIIGKDCMFSHNVDLWSGDGHSIYNVKTGKNVNSVYENLPLRKNQIVIGDHVWVAKGAFIMHGTNIGNGSIIGARSVVKGKFPNNCSIGGNPAKILSADIAWSRDMVSDDIHKCGDEYVSLTVSDEVKKNSRSVLILGGTGRMSAKLTSLCLSNNDDVTIAVRGKHKTHENITSVKKMIFDRNDEEKVKSSLAGKYFDVVFDCSGYTPQTVDWILSSLEIGRYIYVSSFETYAHYYSGLNVSESDLPVNNRDYDKHIEVGEKSWYSRGKYNSELLIANKYPDLNYAIVRIPFVMSVDEDYDDKAASRILQYVSAVVNETSICARNLDYQFNFTDSADEAKFLYCLSENEFKGVVNFASRGSISMNEVIRYVEEKSGKKAIIDNETDRDFPFSSHPELTMNLDKCLSIPYTPLKLEDWIFQKLDKYIAYCIEKK